MDPGFDRTYPYLVCEYTVRYFINNTTYLST